MDSQIPERSQRKALLSIAHCTRGNGETVSIRVRNLSATGLGGSASDPLSRDERVRVDIKGIGEIEGHVAWTRGLNFGMAFDQRVDAGRFEVAEPFLPVPEHYSVNRRFQPVKQSEFKRPGFRRA